ncbi:MAG: hypothetical protein HY718_11540 [Planctomycetes bacterium]|nr:hypothetical protein [Planctomycetota bacterium]
MRSEKWSLFLAAKAIAISVVAIGAAIVLSRMALPKLAETLHGMNVTPAPWVLKGLEYQAELPMLPVPGLLLGIAAIMFKPCRPLLAALALAAAVLATGVIVAMLIGSMAPLYEVPRGLGQ